ncbi:hypothetical protein P5V15_008343 [Pogonomyrmex californicus]
MKSRTCFKTYFLPTPLSFLAVGDRFCIPTSSSHSIFKCIVNTLTELIPQYKIKQQLLLYSNKKYCFARVCDHSARFIDVFIEMSGRMHDARVFRNNPLFLKLTDNQNPLLQRNQYLIGDYTYPLMINLMKTPFRNNGHLLKRAIIGD